MKQGCVHHWVIGIANGPTSDGECQKCGMLKSFYNSIGMDVKQISLKNNSDEPSNARTPWMLSWPTAQMGLGKPPKEQQK